MHALQMSLIFVMNQNFAVVVAACKANCAALNDTGIVCFIACTIDAGDEPSEPLTVHKSL
jgi:hypothetical protein